VLVPVLVLRSLLLALLHTTLVLLGALSDSAPAPAIDRARDVDALGSGHAQVTRGHGASLAHEDVYVAR
jgi:hypothetical protein